MNITFIFLSMTIVSLLLVGMLVLTATQLLSGSMQICRKENLELQKVSAETLNKLESMNKQIKILRVQMKQAQIELAVAIASRNAAAAYAAKSKMTKIQNMQKYLAQAQNFLLKTHQNQMQVRSRTIATRLKIFFYKQKEQLTKIVSIQLNRIQSPPAILAIQADQNSNPPFIYSIVENFTERQISKSYWQWSMEVSLHHWLSNWLSGKFKWSNDCQASLIKKGGLWEATLVNSLDRLL